MKHEKEEVVDILMKEAYELGLKSDDEIKNEQVEMFLKMARDILFKERK